MPGTKTILIQTALKLFAQKGIGNVQAKEIALTAGAVPNAITYHFGGIDGLVDAVWLYAFEQFDHAKLENYYQNNRHLLTSSDGKRQFVTELVGILFDLISGNEKSSTVNLFLMTASVTESGQQKIKEHISSAVVKILMQIYMDISGKNDRESAYLKEQGGCKVYRHFVSSNLHFLCYPNSVKFFERGVRFRLVNKSGKTFFQKSFPPRNIILSADSIILLCSR